MGKPFVMPVAKTEDLTPPSSDWIAAEGAWQGQIEETRIRELPPQFFGGEPEKRGYSSENVEVFSLQIGSLQALEEQMTDDQIGNHKFFTPDIILQDGDLALEDENPDPDTYWQLDKSQRAVTNLALALGFTDEVDLDGEVGLVVAPEFYTMIRENRLKGQGLGFVVYHRKYRSKKENKDKVQQEVSTFTPSL